MRQNLFGQFGTNFFFRNSEPAIAATISSMAGTETLIRQQKNTSYGAHEFRDGVSYSEHQQQKKLIEYSDLASLAIGECFALMPEPQARIVKLKIPEAKLANKNEGFMQSGSPITELQGQDLVQDIEDDNNDLRKLESIEQDSSRSLDNPKQKKDHSLNVVKY